MVAKIITIIATEGHSLLQRCKHLHESVSFEKLHGLWARFAVR